MTSNLNDRRFGIVGGGIMGLVLALELSRRGHRVEVLEAAATMGGLARPYDYGPFVWDRFYHCILDSDRELLALLRELDLHQEVRWHPTSTGFYHDGAFHSLDHVLDFIRFRPLSLRDRLRLGWFIATCARRFDAGDLEQTTCGEFLRRHSGERVWKTVWRPLLRSKLGPSADRTSARFIWETINRMQSARKGPLQRERLGYVPGGYGRILERLLTHLEGEGVRLETGRAVEAVRVGIGGVEISCGDDVRQYDNVVLTTANALTAGLLGPEAARTIDLDGVEFLGVVVGALVLRRPISPYYILNIADSNVGLTSLIGTSNLVADGTFGSHSFYYLPRYLTQGDPAWARSEDEWRTFFLCELRKLVPDFVEDDVVSSHVASARYVQPVLDCNAKSRTPPVRTTLPGISIVNSSQCLEGPVNVNLMIRHVSRTLDEILDA